MSTTPRLDPRLATLLAPVDADVLARWCANTRRQIELASPQRLAGHTRAWLAAVYVTEDGQPVRKCLVKYSPSGSYSTAEPGAHSDALARSPKTFTRNHLINQIWDPVAFAGGGSLMFLEIANAGLAQITTASALFGTSTLGTALGVVVRSVLGDWNTQPRLEPTTAPAVLRDQLAGRLSPGRRLHDWIQAHSGLAEATWLITLDDVLAPNPLAIVDGRLSATAEVRRVVGNAHGDLHLDNVLVSRRPSGNDLRKYRLVDLSNFSGSAPLARDPMVLLLSALAMHLPELGPRTRRAVTALLVDDEIGDIGLISTELRTSVEAVTQAGDDWASRHGLLDEWRIDCMLSLLSAALCQVGRARNAVDAWWFFGLAARAGATFLALTCADRRPDANIAVRVSTLVAGSELVPATSHIDGQPTLTVISAPTTTLTVTSTLISPSTSPTGRQRLAMAELKTLVDAVVGIEALHNPQVWRRIVDRLPAELVDDGATAETLRESAASTFRRFNHYRHLDPWHRLVTAMHAELGEHRGVLDFAQALDRWGMRGEDLSGSGR